MSLLRQSQVRLFILSISCLATCFAVGCSDDGLHGRVSGTIQMDGAPLANAQVEFVPTGEMGSTSYGRTDEQGNYSMEYARDSIGASLGENEVRITTGDMDVDEDENLVRVKEKVPAIYNIKTELRFVVESGSNTADFDLKSEGEILDTTADAAEAE